MTTEVKKFDAKVISWLVITEPKAKGLKTLNAKINRVLRKNKINGHFNCSGLSKAILGWFHNSERATEIMELLKKEFDVNFTIITDEEFSKGAY